MTNKTELMSFTVKLGKEARAGEWMMALQSRRAECVETLGREAMHYESIFRSELAGRLVLSWFSVQGDAGAHVTTSPHAIDELHLAFWRECIDTDIPPGRFEHVVSFVPESINRAIEQRTQDLRQMA